MFVGVLVRSSEDTLEASVEPWGVSFAALQAGVCKVFANLRSYRGLLGGPWKFGMVFGTLRPGGDTLFTRPRVFRSVPLSPYA